jgi:hypothetical protein
MSKNVKTHSEWHALGRRVYKGVPASHFEKGIPYFRREQTFDPLERAAPPDEVAKAYVDFKQTDK